MVSAWYMDDDTTTDKREPHKREPNVDVSLQDLEKIGVLYWKLDTDVENNAELQKIRKDRGYTYEDCITCSRDKLPDYDEKLRMFYEEHLHSDEEIRFCIEGSGYFDVRDKDDKWIRIHITSGDMITLPAGIYHRFTLDTSNYIMARRYFVGEPVWKPHNRPADDHDARKAYVQNILTAPA